MDEETDDETDELIVPDSAFREPTNLELAQLVGLHSRDLFASIAFILNIADLLASDDEKRESAQDMVATSGRVGNWWRNLIEDPEYLNLLKEQESDDED